MHHELHRANYMVDHGGHDSMMYAPGPLTRAMRVLRRVSTLLEEPEPAAPAEPSRWRAGGILGPGLFADGSGKDLLMDMDEEDAALDAAQRSVHIPTLGEEWAGLLDRTFLRLRETLRRREVLGIEGAVGVHYTDPSNTAVVLDDRLYGISRGLSDISRSLQALQVKHAPRPVRDLSDLTAELADLRATVETLVRLVHLHPDDDVSPPSDASPPDDPDDADEDDL